MSGVTLEKMQTKTGDGADTPRVIRLGDLLAEWEEDANAAHEAYKSGKVRGPVTNLPTLDRELGGALSPGLHVVHGNPGSGNSAFVLQVASSCGCPALYVTCEMAPLELFRRLTARITNTYLGRLKTGELLPEQSLALARRAVEAAPHLAFGDATRVFASPDWIASIARAIKGEQRFVLVVVDSVHSWAQAANGDMTEYDALNAALGSLRNIAATLGCPILAVAERNRASMKTGGMSASAGTRKFEYQGESVFDLQREDSDREDANGEFTIGLVIAKNRNGAAGRKIGLCFHGALQRLREVG